MKNSFFVVGLLLAALSKSTVSAQTPFSSVSTDYVYIGAAGYDASTDSTMIFTSSDPASATAFSTSGTTVTGAPTKINGIGLNENDGLLYGIGFPNTAAVTAAAFYRLGADGAAVQLGIIPAPGTTYTAGPSLQLINTTAGTVDAGGNYWYTAYTYDGNPYINPSLANFKFYLGKIPVTTGMATGTGMLSPQYFQLDYSDPAVTLAFGSFLANLNSSNPDASNGGMEDLALNPADGKFYSYLTYPDPNNTSNLLGFPVVINPLTMKVQEAGTTINSPSTGAPNREIAGDWFTPTGQLYVIFTDGQYAGVNLTTGALTNLAQSNLPLENGNLRGDFATNIPVTPLPVTLLSFTGAVTRGANVLQWAAASEAMLSRYIVERSEDGKNFAAIGSIKPNTTHSYSMTDATAPATAYYRLNMADMDGSSRYSAVIRLVNNSGGTAATSVYPTLLDGNELHIVSGRGDISVMLTDISGKPVARSTFTARESSPFIMPLPALFAGMYFLTIRDGGNGAVLLVQRIIKQ